MYACVWWILLTSASPCENLYASAYPFAGLACTSKSFVRKEPDDKLIDQVVEGCHAVQMLSGLVRRYGEL